MRREAPAPSKTPAKVDALRRLVAEAADERARLAAKLALARHFADVADGVNGLVVASEARTLALKRKDFAALAHALVSASISQYHRSAYVNAIAVAMDAYDCARRSEQ